MEDSKLPDPKSFKGGYVKIKNDMYGGVRGLRKWTQMHPNTKPRPYQRTGKDTGVV